MTISLPNEGVPWGETVDNEGEQFVLVSERGAPWGYGCCFAVGGAVVPLHKKGGQNCPPHGLVKLCVS